MKFSGLNSKVILFISLMIFLCGYVWIQRMATYHSEFSNLLDDGVEDDNVPLMSHHENQQLRFAVDILVETVMNASLVKIPELEPSSASFEDDNYRNLTVIIHTSLNNFERRQIIRDTWGGWLRQNGQQVFFIIGSSNQSAEGIKRKIQEEHELHHDMIEYDFVDSYHNLTLKTLLTLRFFNEKILKLETKVQQTKWKLNITSSISGPILRQTQYLLKTDDDVVYHPKNLQRWRDFVPQKIIGKQEESRYYRGIILGNVMAHFRPNRNKKSKYFVSEKIYSGKIYPNIVSGTGYIMSEDVARSLFITAVIAKRCKFFPLEDVFLTGLCATKAVKMTNYSTYSGETDEFLDARMINHPGFIVENLGSKFDFCKHYTPYLTKISHNLGPALMKGIWKKLNSSEDAIARQCHHKRGSINGFRAYPLEHSFVS